MTRYRVGRLVVRGAAGSALVALECVDAALRRGELEDAIRQAEQLALHADDLLAGLELMRAGVVVGV